MGYRSYVYVITDVRNKALIAALKAAKPDEEDTGMFKFWNLSNATPKTTEVMLFEFHERKWYESYADVNAIMSEINELIHDDKSESFGYIEVGEELDDITHLGHPWDYDMCLNRSVDMPILERKEEE